MANETTSLTEVPNLNPFFAYVQDQTTLTHRLIGSPAVFLDPTTTRLIREGGKQTLEIDSTLHLVNTSGGVTENISTDSTDDKSVPTKLKTNIMKAVILHRNATYSSADIVEVMGNIALMQQAGREAAEVLIDFRNVSLVNTLEGVLGALGSSHRNAIFTEDGDNATSANKINDNAIIDTAAPWGDMAGAAMLIMHSDVYRDLKKLDLIDFVSSSGVDLGFGFYLGYSLFIDDRSTKRAGTTTGFVYTVFMLRAGAVGFGLGIPKVPVAAWRVEDEGNGEGVEYLATRDRYSWYPQGMSFTGSPSGTTASNAELATSGNWTQVRSDKQIGITALVVNV